MSNKSLFSEAGDGPRGQPQPSALASKRPRFNVSIYGSPVLVSVIVCSVTLQRVETARIDYS